ncbi:MAG: DUF3604 domain-containing protein [Planctomycetota bacterium]
MPDCPMHPQALFDAFRRRETYATTGPRIQLRFFAGWEFEADDAVSDLAATGYAKGVPMGGELAAAPEGARPHFLIRAARDPAGANLDRIQLVKGWIDANGESHEHVFDVALSDGRELDATGRAPAVGDTVDRATGRYSNDIGDAELSVVWSDPQFDPAQPAFYYVRVLEIPTPRWTLLDAIALGRGNPAGLEATVQERAYSSPVWYRPEE